MQIIRTGAILQLLLGNIGRPGWRHHGAARAREHPGLHRHPDAVQPAARLHARCRRRRCTSRSTQYVEADEGAGGLLGQHARSYAVSLLKAYFGDAATADNDFCFDYLPRLTGDHSHLRRRCSTQIDGKVQGLLPGRREPGGRLGQRQDAAARLANLDWLVVRDLVMIESATFWKDGPEIETGELRHRGDRHRGVLPAGRGAHREERHRSPTPSGCCSGTTRPSTRRATPRSDLWFYYHLGQRIREKLAGSTDEMDRPLLDLAWDYPERGHEREPSAEAVLREINGTGPDGAALSAYTELKPDGSTSVRLLDLLRRLRRRGQPGGAAASRAGEQSWVAPEWGWAWPANRRILYNRASADPDGKPWSERKAYVWWDAEEGKWTGHDVPDFIPDREPHHVPDGGREGPGRHRRLATRSSCRPTARAGCSRRPAWPTGRCRPTTSRRSRRCATPLYGQQTNPAGSTTTTTSNADQPEPAATSSRSCSRPTG